MIDYKAFGRRMKERRLALRFTQEQLAEKLSVSTEYISRLETGRFRPSISLIERIALLMETTEQFLLFGSKEEQNLNRQLVLQIEQLSPNQKEVLFGIIRLLESGE